MRTSPAVTYIRESGAESRGGKVKVASVTLFQGWQSRWIGGCDVYRSLGVQGCWFPLPFFGCEVMYVPPLGIRGLATGLKWIREV